MQGLAFVRRSPEKNMSDSLSLCPDATEKGIR